MDMDNQHLKRKEPPSLKYFLYRLNHQLDEILTMAEEWTGGGYGYEKSYEHYADEKYYFNNIETMVLVLEDRYFLRHRGFDVRSLPRALRRRWSFGRWGGTSTIEQQFVRTVIQRRERTLRRKFREVILAMILNFHLTKLEILGAYLSCAYYGCCGYGADSPSIIIFEKDAKDLNIDEAAFIASLLVYPIPCRVVRAARADGRFPVPNVRQFLTHYAAGVDEIWARRVLKRMDYGLRFLRLSNLPSKYANEIS